MICTKLNYFTLFTNALTISKRFDSPYTRCTRCAWHTPALYTCNTLYIVRNPQLCATSDFYCVKIALTKFLKSKGIQWFNQFITYPRPIIKNPFWTLVYMTSFFNFWRNTTTRFVWDTIPISSTFFSTNYCSFTFTATTRPATRSPFIGNPSERKRVLSQDNITTYCLSMGQT